MKRIAYLFLLLSLTAGHVSSEEFAVDLPTVLRLAGANNLTIQMAREKAEEARARQTEARGLWLPTLGIGSRLQAIDGFTQATGGAFVDVDKQFVQPGVYVSLDLRPGEVLYASLQARQRADAAAAWSEAESRHIRYESVQAYYELLLADAEVRLFDETLSLYDDFLNQMEKRVKAGLGYKVDVLRVKTELSREKFRALEARQRLRLASVQLANLLMLETDLILVPSEELLPMTLIESLKDEAHYQAHALLHRPELRAGSLERDAAQSERKAAAYAALFPHLEVDAFGGRFGQDHGSLGSRRDVRVYLGWEIGPGGLFSPGRKRGAESRLRLAEIAQSQIERSIMAEVSAAYESLLASTLQMALSQETVKHAEESLRLNSGRHKMGIAQPLEVIQAEDAFLASRLSALRSVAKYNVGQYRLQVASGSGF